MRFYDRPRFTLAAALVLATTVGLLAQQPRPTNPPAAVKPETISADEQQIRQAAISFVEQFNTQKLDALVANFAPDARMTFRDDTEVNGRDELKKSFEAAFAANPKDKISLVVDSIRFLTPDVAVEEGSTSNFPDGETLTARSRYTVLHVKKSGRWLMQATRVIEEESLSAYGDLRPLEWLVGEWIDEGRAEVVEAKFRWDDNKSFLIEEFQVVREGSVVLKGTQRIGWDPQAKQVRSWIFDNAGGFGEATWSQVDDQWVSKMKGVQANGTSTSATRILLRAAQDRAIWISQDRLAGDEALPDMTVTMVRKPPEPMQAAAK